ncbi:MAG: hypothetical protein K0S74_1803 [Chlamydiales bacterium]|jgi:chromosome segregation ATPase|nr:hypothetical protein [Chlamydiales bacterium]
MFLKDKLSSLLQFIDRSYERLNLNYRILLLGQIGAIMVILTLIAPFIKLVESFYLSVGLVILIAFVSSLLFYVKNVFIYVALIGGLFAIGLRPQSLWDWQFIVSGGLSLFITGLTGSLTKENIEQANEQAISSSEEEHHHFSTEFKNNEAINIKNAEQIASLQQQLDSKQKECEELSSQLQFHENLFATINQEIDMLQQERQVLQGQIVESHARIADLSYRQQQLITQHDSAQGLKAREKIEELEKQISALESSKQEMAAETKQFHDKFIELENVYCKVQQEAIASAIAEKQLTEKCESLSSQLIDTQLILKKEEEKQFKQLQKFKYLEKNLIENEFVQQQLIEAVNTAVNQLQQFQEKYGILQHKLKGFQIDLEHRSQEVDSEQKLNQQKIDQLEAIALTSTESLAGYKAQAELLHNQKLVLQQQLDSKATEIQALWDSQVNMQHDETSAQQRLIHLEAELEEQKQHFHQISSLYKQLKQQFEEKTEVLHQARVEVFNYEGELLAIKNEQEVRIVEQEHVHWKNLEFLLQEYQTELELAYEEINTMQQIIQSFVEDGAYAAL